MLREWVVRYLRPQWRRAGLMAVLLLSGIGLQLGQPLLVRAFIDQAVAGGAARTLLLIAGSLIGAALVTQAVTVAATYLSEQVGWAATNLLRADLLRHSLGLDMRFHLGHTPGEMIERIDGDITAMATLFTQLVVRVLGSVLLMIGVLALLLREDLLIGTALLAYVALALGVLYVSRAIAVPRMTVERGAWADLFGFIEERLAGLDDLRANGAGGWVIRGFTGQIRSVVRAVLSAAALSALLWVITTMLFALGIVLALALGVWRYRDGAITLGTVYLLFQYTQLLRGPMEQIAQQLREFQRAAAGGGRVTRLLATAPSILDGPGATLPDGPLALRFDAVSFAYGDGELALNDVSFAVAPGRVLGVLGRTGSGKTTLTRLLLRLYDPTAGTIRLGGCDLRALRLDALHHAIGIVTQDVQLFQASVRDNLTLFDHAVEDARIVTVLTELGLLDWLIALPAGLDTELPPGGGVSAGEAQLLAFARVYLRDPHVVILDEASSRLDPATERLIERAVDRLLAGRTAIVIAHRLGTVERAEDILVLDDGRVCEHGPRAALAADAGSRYAALLAAGELLSDSAMAGAQAGDG